MIRKHTIALMAALVLSSSLAMAQDDDNDDRPVIRKDRHSHSNKIDRVGSIYAISLMHVTEDNVGFGASYEHFLDKKGIMSLYLPVSYALPNANLSNFYVRDANYYGYSGYYYNDLQDEFLTPKGMLNFYPGIKIYPSGAHKKVTYALGSSLLFGIGSANRRVLDYRIDTVNNNGYTQYKQTLVKDNSETLTRFRMGMLITNYLNIRPGNNYYLGLEFGLGYSYFNSTGSSDEDRTALVQLGLKIGLTD